MGKPCELVIGYTQHAGCRKGRYRPQAATGNTTHLKLQPSHAQPQLFGPQPPLLNRIRRKTTAIATSMRKPQFIQKVLHRKLASHPCRSELSVALAATPSNFLGPAPLIVARFRDRGIISILIPTILYSPQDVDTPAGFPLQPSECYNPVRARGIPTAHPFRPIRDMSPP